MKTIPLLLALSTGITLAQGPLTPPGAPAPSMKSLGQIEPRTDVLQLPGDATAMRVISAPGSYFLSANLVADSGKSGIRIDANNVTLDLMGFLISGASVNDAAGVRLNEALQGISITNGSFKGFASMISKTTTLKNVTASHLKGSEDIKKGIILGLYNGTVVNHCNVILSSSGSDGIEAEQVHYCTVDSDNSFTNGVAIKASSIVSHSTAKGALYGISAGASGAMVDNCIANGLYSGIYCNGNVANSAGSGIDRGIGIEATGNVSNCAGSGRSRFDGQGYGILSGGSVTNSSGNARAYLDPAAEGAPNPSEYAVSATAIQAKVISYSNAVGTDEGIALAEGLHCTIAVGCTSTGNDVITNKYLMP